MSSEAQVQGGAANGKANGATTKIRILFADDNQDTLDLLAATAKLRGWASETARSTEEIIAKVTSECSGRGRCFDALILDVRFDDSGQPSGIQAVRAVRRNFPNIPVIFITGWTSRFVKDEALRVGQEVITKPFDPNYVLDRAEVWMIWAGAHTPCYTGTERRSQSINRSGYYRRATDKPVVINERVIAAMAQEGK
jgi:DNA-binding response OmpR family regulator